jgi:hypothetical protein
MLGTASARRVVRRSLGRARARSDGVVGAGLLSPVVGATSSSPRHCSQSRPQGFDAAAHLCVFVNNSIVALPRWQDSCLCVACVFSPEGQDAILGGRGGRRGGEGGGQRRRGGGAGGESVRVVLLSASGRRGALLVSSPAPRGPATGASANAPVRGGCQDRARAVLARGGERRSADADAEKARGSEEELCARSLSLAARPPLAANGAGLRRLLPAAREHTAVHRRTRRRVTIGRGRVKRAATAQRREGSQLLRLARGQAIRRPALTLTRARHDPGGARARVPR